MREAVIPGVERESPLKEVLSREEDPETVLRDPERDVRHGQGKAEQDLSGVRGVLREAREDLTQEEKAEGLPEETAGEASVREEEETKMSPYSHRN